MPGQQFLDQFGPTIDTATSVDPKITYPVQHAADHHVLEAQRIRNFVAAIEDANREAMKPEEEGRPSHPATSGFRLPASGSQLPASGFHHALRKAGHLMYASHISYRDEAMLGAPECDLIVDLVRQNESAGLYGAKITGGGSGGTVAILAQDTLRADAAIAQILSAYQSQTGHPPDLFSHSSPGAWQVGTEIIHR